MEEKLIFFQMTGIDSEQALNICRFLDKLGKDEDIQFVRTDSLNAFKSSTKDPHMHWMLDAGEETEDLCRP
jgi:hypothetical protein